MTSKPAGSAILAALEGLWGAARVQHPELPEVMMILSSGSEKKGKITWGHCAPFRWQGKEGALHEIMVSGEGLSREPREVLATVLHEAAHTLAIVRGVKDTSRAGEYHNKFFKAIAESLGLIIEQTGRIGWSKTSIPDDTVSRYTAPLADLTQVMTVVRRHEGRGARVAKGSETKNGVVMKCPDPFGDCGRQFRISPTAAALGAIMCGPCGVEFEIKDEG